jgi:hypothetical protein
MYRDLAVASPDRPSCCSHAGTSRMKKLKNSPVCLYAGSLALASLLTFKCQSMQGRSACPLWPSSFVGARRVV